MKNPVIIKLKHVEKETLFSFVYFYFYFYFFLGFQFLRDWMWAEGVEREKETSLWQYSIESCATFWKSRCPVLLIGRMPYAGFTRTLSSGEQQQIQNSPNLGGKHVWKLGNTAMGASGTKLFIVGGEGACEFWIWKDEMWDLCTARVLVHPSKNFLFFFLTMLEVFPLLYLDHRNTILSNLTI